MPRLAMRVSAAFAAICALSQIALIALAQTALAQTPDCKSMADADARLVCYDNKAASVVKPGARPLASISAPAAKTDNGKYVDTIGAEDALMNARLKNICKGC
jgi:hypothetical protein